MKRLILIKHAPPEVDPHISSEQWHLGERGRHASEALARRLASYAIGEIVTSNEPKAKQTGDELARILGVKTRPAEGLHEHDRRNVPHMRSAEFISMMELFFRKPGERLLGNETADEARMRFENAIDHVLEEAMADVVAVVTHGTVLALFLADHGAQKKAFELWRGLGLPSFAVVTMPSREIVEIVERI